MNEANTFRLAKGVSYTHFKFVIFPATGTAIVYKLFGDKDSESLSDDTVVVLSEVDNNFPRGTKFTIKHDVVVPVNTAREFWKILVKYYGYHPNSERKMV